MFTPAIITAVVSLDATRFDGTRLVSRRARRRRLRLLPPFAFPRDIGRGALHALHR